MVTFGGQHTKPYRTAKNSSIHKTASITTLWTHAPTIDCNRLIPKILSTLSNTHTHTRLTAFVRDYLGEPVPER